MKRRNKTKQSWKPKTNELAVAEQHAHCKSTWTAQTRILSVARPWDWLDWTGQGHLGYVLALEQINKHKPPNLLGWTGSVLLLFRNSLQRFILTFLRKNVLPPPPKIIAPNCFILYKYFIQKYLEVLDKSPSKKKVQQCFGCFLTPERNSKKPIRHNKFRARCP